MPTNNHSHNKRLGKLIEAIVQVAEGNYDIQTPLSEEYDELDAIAIGFNSMVDEIKDKTQQTKHSEERFRKLLETAIDAIIITNKNLEVISWNNGAKSLFGYQEKEMEGCSIMDVIPKDHHASFKKSISVIEKNNNDNPVKQATELEGLDKNQNIFPIEFSINSWESDKNKFYCLIIRDISNRKKAEEELKESEEKYRSLIQHMNEGVLYVDNNEVILFVNQRFLEITGYKQKDLIGKVAHDVFFDKNSAEYQQMVEITKIRKKKKASTMKLPMKKKDGSIIWMQNSGAPLLNSNDEVIGSVGILADIHDLVTAENKIIEKNKELSIFIYRASHDLKGPLSSVMGVINLGRKELSENKPAMQYMDMIDKSMQRMQQILADLTSLAELAQKKPNKAEINIEESIDSILFDTKRFQEYDYIDIRKNIHCKTCIIDRSILTSILQNLIENAVKYHQVTIDNPYIEISVSSVDGGLEIIIADNGPGMEKEVQQKVFDMFYRASYNSDGTGLGLYLVKSSVEKLGGQIDLKSKLGKGTTFHVSIPSVIVKEEV